MTDPYDARLSALRNHVDELGTWLGIWVNRAEPDAYARRCANDAVDAIDAMLRNLYLVRGRLTGEVRAADDVSTARAADALNQRGSWMESAHRGSCTTCDGVWEPGSQVRYDPAGGRPGQLRVRPGGAGRGARDTRPGLGDEEDASPEPPAPAAT
jgi:hypothetical protein